MSISSDLRVRLELAGVIRDGPSGVVLTALIAAQKSKSCVAKCNTIYPNGKTTKIDLVQRLDRIQRLLEKHRREAIPLRAQCANHLADALGCLAKCLLDNADNALAEAEKVAAETTSEPAKPPRTFTLSDLEAIVRGQRASLPEGVGHPLQGWPSERQ